MEIKAVYKELMGLNALPNNQEKADKTKALFERLKKDKIPEHFNWASDVFEAIHVKERPNQAALIWANLETGEDKKLTYKEFSDEGNRALNYLRGRGMKKGDNVYLVMALYPQIWTFTLASLKGGFVVVPTATTMTIGDLEYRFKLQPPHAIVTDDACVKIVEEALAKLKATPKVKMTVGKRDGWEGVEALKKEGASAAAEKTASKDTSFCIFTSATTGMAKRVEHSSTAYPIGHLSTAYMMGIKPGDVHNNLSAAGWAKWAWSSFFAPLSMGATTTGFYHVKFDAGKYLAAVSKYKINTFCAPPTAWRAFMLQDLSKFKFDALRESGSAGEPLNPEVIQKWKRFTGSEIRDFYGQTESTAMIGNAPWDVGTIIPGSFGHPSLLYDVALADDDGNEVKKPGEVGHIVVKMANGSPLGLFRSYIGEPEKMKSVFKHNFYYTGDRAFIDENGYWWFVGRADDVIKSSDYRIGPFEVESALIEHPAVAEAAVVGSPDHERYQLVKGFVILKPGYEPSRELALEIFQHTKKVLAKYKLPRILEFSKELPKTTSGKIRRIDLRAVEIQNKNKGVKANNEYYMKDFPELKG